MKESQTDSLPPPWLHRQRSCTLSACKAGWFRCRRKPRPGLLGQSSGGCGQCRQCELLRTLQMLRAVCYVRASVFSASDSSRTSYKPPFLRGGVTEEKLGPLHSIQVIE